METLVKSDALVDTNVLLYATDAQAPQHVASLALLNRAVSQQIRLFLTSQIIFEFVGVATNQRQVARPIEAFQAWSAVAKFRQVCTLLDPPADFVDRVSILFPVVQPKGAEIFDLAIGVTALAAGILDIYSYDSSVFIRVPGMRVITP